MGSPIGFVSIPRSAEVPRLSGGFFSATVEAKQGPNSWKMSLNGHSMVVTTNLDLEVGQNLRLKVVSQEAHRWVLELVSRGPKSVPTRAEFAEASPTLLAAFASQGLPLAIDRLKIWSHWLATAPRTTDHEGWSASLEARGEDPSGAMADGLRPWMEWQKNLEKGTPGSPPEDESYWDWWNTRRPRSSDPWLVMPLHWIHEGHSDSGLLQAHWSSQAQGIDQWHLTAAPAQVPFRLEAKVRPTQLDLTWRFFQESDLHDWTPLVKALATRLSVKDLTVTLVVAGPQEPVRSFAPLRIDLDA